MAEGYVGRDRDGTKDLDPACWTRLIPDFSRGSETIQPDGKKELLRRFRRDAVELYRVTEGATVAQIAADLGIAHGSLSAWLKAAGVPIRKHGHAVAPPGPAETHEQEATRLRERVRELEAESVKLNTERDILRAAAKYFAGETNW